MAAFMVALKRLKDGGFAARKVIPKDVRQEYASLYGMAWEEKLSIPKGTPAEEAKARHCEWLAEIESRIASLRAAKMGTRQSLTRRNAHALAGEWYRWFLGRNEGDLRTPSHWQRLSDTLIWDVIYPHAPDEYLRDTKADPEWEWKAAPEVRDAVRPLVAQETKVASFLLEKGMALNDDAMGLFLDAVEANLLTAYVRLQALARGYYGPDPALDDFPEYVAKAERARRGIGCSALFERWQSEVSRRVARLPDGSPSSKPQTPDFPTRA